MQIVKRITSGFSTASTVVSLKPAPAVSAPVSGTVKVGVGLAEGISQSPLTALSSVSTAEGLVTSATGTASAQVGPAPAAQTVMALAPAPISEGEKQTVYVNLTGTYGATSATNTTVSGSAWASSGNATGAHNGTMSTHNGNVTAQHAYLTFAFPTYPDKTGLTITAAKLRFWSSQGGTALNNGGLRYTYGTAANPDLNTVSDATGNVDHTVTPFEVDLFAAGYTTWAQLEAIQARIRGTLAAGTALVTQSADAVEIVVTATA